MYKYRLLLCAMCIITATILVSLFATAQKTKNSDTSQQEYESFRTREISFESLLFDKTKKEANYNIIKSNELPPGEKQRDNIMQNWYDRA